MCHHTVIWVELSNCLYFDQSKDVYLCFVLIPHENNIFYESYVVDIFELLNQEIAIFNALGHVVAMGDWNTVLDLNRTSLNLMN